MNRNLDAEVNVGAYPVIGPFEWVCWSSRVRTRGLLAYLSKNRRFPRKSPLYFVPVIVITDSYGAFLKVRLMTAKSPQHPELLGTFSKFHSLPQINRGALASGTILCFFMRFGCIFSLDNIPRSFHLGSLIFCVVTQNSMHG